MAKHIAVWLDRTSDRNNPAWVVSLEDGDTSTTLATFDGSGYEQSNAAHDRAYDEAAERGLAVVEK